MALDRKLGFSKLQTLFAEIFGLSRTVALCASILVVGVAISAIYWSFHQAPPSVITITSGPEGSIFFRNAERYQKILARSGIRLKILSSEGSSENLKRLSDPSSRVDIGFVQGGVAAGMKIDDLQTLGSLYSSPILLFYRSAAPFDLLSQLSGKRIAIGSVGSGSHALALSLLAANGIEPDGSTTLENLDAEDASKALVAGKLDAVFLMGESSPPEVMRSLLRTPGIRLYSFSQADAYVRRMVYLNKLDLPRGVIDFEKDIPSRDISLVGPTVELVARAGLHPALSDLLLEAAREVHGGAGLFRRQGEFPTPLEHEFRISPDALRFYKSGKSFLYRSLPFWMASLANRILVVVVPMVVVLIPALRSIPALYRWRIRLIIYRWYRALLAIERDTISPREAGERVELLDRLNRIEQAVNRMKVPASFADQFYVLRGHIAFVRERLKKGQP
ncbi:MAG TPA: TAXI family TRAP transporter solute-binding subunit [Nitrospirota bacterium]|nr:TAXI family TRAP transporter solute-binding subunit [Nitrospirota bacterium]